MDLDELQSLEPAIVIEHKLAQAAKLHPGRSLMVEDTSLILACLRGLPGTYIKAFEQTLGAAGIAALAMKYENRTAVARTTIGFLDEHGKQFYFVGELTGEIVAPRGSKEFGWNPIFVPSGHQQTFGEMTLAAKNKLSMRAIAARKLAAHLSRA
jgi:inosine triphosphate pyrophosphatase